MNLYINLNKFVTFQNVTNNSIHGHGPSNEACCERNQANKTMVIPYVTKPGKTDHVGTTSEMHFVAPYHRYIHTLYIKTQ